VVVVAPASWNADMPIAAMAIKYRDFLAKTEIMVLVQSDLQL